VIEVLIVDDDFMVARIHTGFVERTPGFTVTGVAKTGAEALELAARLQPDLVLLDVYLPDISGLDLLSDLREAAPEVDVLVISAAREADTVRRALRGGIVHYLMKPFSYEDLRVRLEHYQMAYAAMEGEHTEQADIDRVFNITPSGKLPPKGFSPETLKLVEDALRGRDQASDLSAAETASLLGISRVSARRYLEHLTEKGKLEVSLRYGEVGRPERRYSWRSTATK
jgi:response regulator of citrate/malate metabolism